MRTRVNLAALVALVVALCTPTLATSAEGIAPSQLDELGSIGGGSYAIAVSGNTALIGEGTNLVAIDTSTPRQPRLKGRLKLPGHPLAITIAGSMAFVKTSVYADGYLPALQLVDVRDPSQPQLRASYTTATMPAASGNLIYLAGYDGLHIIDASDPSQLVERGVYSAAFYPIRVELVGSLVVLTESDKLYVFDVHDPAHPTVAGQLGSLTTTATLQIQGTRAYLAGGQQLMIIDLADPSAPVIRSQITLPSYARSMTIAGSLAYIATAQTASIFAAPQTLVLVDISTPSAPAILGSYFVASAIASIQVGTDLVFVAATGAGLQVLDVSQPAAPRLYATYQPGAVYDLRIVDRLAYLAVDGRGFEIVDFTNASQPVQYSMLRLIGSVVSVQVAGGLAVLLDSQSLWVVDVRQPDSPIAITRVDRGGGLLDIASPWIEVHQNVAYVGYLAVKQSNETVFQELDILVLNLENAPHPAVIGATSASLQCGKCARFARFAFANDTILAAYGTTELLLFDLGDPFSPVAAGTVFISGGAVDVQAAGQRVYVQGAIDRVTILEIDTAGHARWLGAYTASGPLSTLRAAGNIIYLATDANFEIVDALAPAAPVQIGSCQVERLSTRVDAVSGRVYLRSLAYVFGWGYTFAFETINISDLAHPSPLGGVYLGSNVATQFSDTVLVAVGGQRYPNRPLNGRLLIYRLPFPDAGLIANRELPAPPHDAAVEGTHIYVANGASGLRLYRFYLQSYLPLMARN